MALFSDMVAGAQFRADLQGSARVSQAEWATLVNEAILSVWHLASSARPDFQVKSADFTIANGNSASFTVPADFYDEVDLVFAPDTVNEYSLGPFAWQNRRAPGSWLPPFVTTGAGATRARLQGQTMYVEPSLRAAGSYRLWYCPTPKTQNFTARLATAGLLPAYTASGTGAGKTLTATASAALTVDGVAVAVADRILVKNEAPTGNVNNGIYTVTATGSGVAPYVLTRAFDYDDNVEIALGNIILIQEGTVNTDLFYELVVFGGSVDTTSQSYAIATIDPILVPFAELIRVKAAIPAVARDNRSAADLQNRAAALEPQLTTFFRQVRTSNVPQKMVDTDMIGPRWFGGSW